MDTEAVVARLDTPSGFTSLMKGMFREGRGKKAYATWTSAQSRAVYETVELRFSAHDSRGYAVLAYSDNGPIDQRTRKTLTAQAELFPLGTLRYESVPYSGLLPHGWHPHSYNPKDHTIDAIAAPYPGVHVFTALMTPTAADRPLVAHCVLNGRAYIYPIPGDTLD